MTSNWKNPEHWQQALNQARSADAGRLNRLWQRWRRQEDPLLLAELGRCWQESCAQVEQRRQELPLLEYPDLPVSQRREELVERLRKEPVLIIAGETGSGKTTQIPKLCLEAGRGVRGLIGHTQPRRLAARQVALRLAEEMHTPLGEHVGCSMRFSDQTSAKNFIKVMTDGILLAELRQDRWLSAYDTLIIDEAHERSLNIDFILGTLKLLRQRRQDLQIVVTSATLQVEKFSDFFAGAPIVVVEGRNWPVETYYQPLLPKKDAEEEVEPGEELLASALRQALEFCWTEERKRRWLPGDVLVFLSTERELRQLHAQLRDLEPAIEILPLYARLSAAEQQKVFAPHQQRRIILATNVAETSITVPGIRHVIDAGRARISRYSWRTKVQRLPIEAISQSSAKQRQGRAGRTAAGICVRLYSEEDFRNRPEFTDPEILRTHLSAVILQMYALGLGEMESFPWLDAPDSRRINDGYRQLEVLEALDRQRQLTPLGKELARWPVDPQLACVLWRAWQLGSLPDALAIVAALAIQEIRERPREHAALADERHGRFMQDGSDLQFYARLWQHLQQQWPDWSDRQRRAFAREHFLSWMRLNEWREMHRLLRLECEHRGWQVGTETSGAEQIAAALLAGFPEQVARREEQKDYRGVRGQKARLHPSSVLVRKPAEWVLAIEWVETQRLYLRQVVRLDPLWIERQLPHLLKKSWHDPHWERRQGRAMVLEQIHLLGLQVHPGRAVPLSHQDPLEARRLLISEGLVAGDIDLQVGFLKTNQQLLQRLHEMEERSRRRDLVLDASGQFAFYDAQLPASVVDVPSLQVWYRQTLPHTPALLLMTEDLLQRPQTAGVMAEFPEVWPAEGGDFALSYVFAPGDRRDGVTLTCPVGRYHSLPWKDFEHLVPGLRPEKILCLLRGLAKTHRRQLVPIQELAACLDPPRSLPLLEGLCQAIARERQVQLTPVDFQDIALPLHVQLNIRVVAPTGELLIESRLRQELDAQVARWLQTQHTPSVPVPGNTAWTDWREDLLEMTERGEGLARQRLFAALQDQGNRVQPVELLRPMEARKVHARGCARLYALAVADLLKPWQQKIRKSQVSQVFTELAPLERLAEEWVLALVIFFAGLDQQLPYRKADYSRQLSLLRGALAEQLPVLWQQLEAIARQVRQVRQGIATLDRALPELRQDLQAQLAGLVDDNWPIAPGYRYWQHYPRYLNAMLWRLQRGGVSRQRDLPLMQEVQQRLQQCHVVLEERERLQEPVEQILQYRWMLEEYRVSLFAQHIRTAQPVSAVRLDRWWEQVRADLKIR